MADDLMPMVLDIGSGNCKSGFAGDEQPRSIFSTLVGKEKTSTDSATSKEKFIGDQAQAKRDVLNLNYPVKHGIVTDWDDMEDILNFIFQQELHMAPDQDTVLITEPPLNPRSNKENWAKLMFEKFQVLGFAVSVPGVLSLYASGRGAGIMLDIGDGVTHVVPIHQGCTVQRAIKRMDIAGGEITTYLQEILKESGHSFLTQAERESVRELKENVSYCAQEYDREMLTCQASSSKEKSYTLPDGTSINVGSERFRCTEILFQPSILDREDVGIHNMVCNSIKECDIDMRRDFYNNVILSSGSSMIPGIADRLTTEIRKLIPQSVSCKVVENPERKYSVWIGGSVLASLSTFSNLWITKEEYEEYGPLIMHRKTIM